MMKKLYLFLCSVMFALFFTIISVHADTGPKPVTYISISGLPNSSYAMALVTKYDGYFGPHKAYVPNDTETDSYYGDYEDLTLIYQNVNIPEGYYLSDISYRFTGSSYEYKSGYLYPSEYRVVFYDTINDQSYITDTIKDYAFSSYFSLKYTDGQFNLKRSYNYGKEIALLVLRIALTLGVELGLAFFFKFTKKSYIILASTNAATQLGLNIFLNVWAYTTGKSQWVMIPYILIELGIFVVEAVLFKLFCKRGKERTNRWIILYTLLANILSFGIGIGLWFIF